MPSVSTFGTTGDSYLDGLFLGIKWGVTSLTFSFPTSASFYGGSGYSPDEEWNNNFEAFNSTQQTAVRAALQNYSQVSNLSFTEVTETSTVHGDLRYAMSDDPPTAWGYYPSTNAYGGDSWYNNSSGNYDNPLKGNYAWQTMLHETGHALGLTHPHDTGDPLSAGFNSTMPTDKDSLEYTVMSYRSYIGASTGGGYTNGASSFPQTLMMYDILAVQTLYGANFNTNSGDTTYSWNSTTGEMSIGGTGQGAPTANKVFMTVWDGGGVDTYDFSNYSTNLTVNLQPGAWTTTSSTQLADLGNSHVAAGNIANALLYQGNTASLIENAIGGSGNDTITGNAAINSIQGGAGNDTIYGGDGDEFSLQGGADNDTLYGENGNDFLNGGAGADVLDGGSGGDWAIYVDATSGVSIDYGNLGASTGEAAGDTFTSIECLYGSAYNDVLSWDNNSNILNGQAGDDFLFGKGGDDWLLGGDGDDFLTGGSGSDTLDGGGGGNFACYVDATSGVSIMYGSLGSSTGDAAGDTFTSIHHLVGSDFNDTLSWDDNNNILMGQAGNDTLWGNGGDDWVIGGDGNDNLDGGAGADLLTGDAGNDLFVFVAGQANGDVLSDFTGNGASTGDSLLFIGYGSSASFSQLSGTDWLISDGAFVNDIITLSNSPTIHVSDYLFI